jgi:hypothetical protein
MDRHTILFLAANPVGTDRLALDEEARAIHVELERSGHRDRFDLVTRWAARPLDLLRELRKLKPTVVHFSGHGGRLAPSKHRSERAPRRDVVIDDRVQGSQEGLLFQDRNGRPQRVSAAALQQTFGAAGSSVRVIVLSACYSSAQADALSANVDCVVGMRSAIDDHAARSFAIGFYGGLGDGESVATAFEQGRAAISLERLRDRDRPQLQVRTGVDAGRMILAAVPASITARGTAAGTSFAAAQATMARPSAFSSFIGAASPAATTPTEALSPAMSSPERARSAEADERLARVKRDVTAVLTVHPRLIQPLADRLDCRGVPDVIADRILESKRQGSDVVALLLDVWDAQSAVSDGHIGCQAALRILCIVLPYVPDWQDAVEQVRTGKEEIVLRYSSATIAEAVMAGGAGRHCNFEQKAGAAPYGKWAVELPSDAQTATFTSAEHVRDSVVEMLDRELGVGGPSAAARLVRVQRALRIRRNLKGPHREQRYLLFRDAEQPEFLYALVRTALQGETGLPDLRLVRLRGSGEDGDEAGIEHSVRLMLQPLIPR